MRMRRLAGTRCILVSLVLLVAFSADATRLIVGYVNSSLPVRDSLYEVNPATGEAVRLFGLPAGNVWGDLAARSDDPGGVYGVSRIPGLARENRISRIDLASGAVTDLYSFLPADFGLAPTAILELSGIAIDASDPSHALITANVTVGSTFSALLFDLDLETGARSAALTISGVSVVERLALAPDGTLLTVTLTQSRRLAAIDPATASATLIGSCNGPACTISSMEFDPANEQLLAISVGGELGEISPVTGEQLRDIGPTGLGSGGQPASTWGMAFVVPEPHTGVLLSVGLCGLSARRRRRSFAL
jgi:hypothetical protein